MGFEINGNVILYLILGLVAGIFSGLFGIGGGIILIPGFLYFLGCNQHQAQGMSLAVLIPPIGLLAAYKYYQEGNINVAMAIFVCLGFFFGALFGAEIAHKINGIVLRRVFGILLLLLSLKMIFGKIS